ncbi:putative porin [Luteimonas sp. BDR2-5]|uniref:putative porin n=1 Tax=Proluteimonas luteida TaxID=2878685 RepID=UPI001E603785|nr:putative porin [Luteimonas sp. BDR2-5]MCD9029517.1 putative porin [Luteimonas sp. BDR2-5]
MSHDRIESRIALLPHATLALALLGAGLVPAHAQDPAPDDLVALRAELAALKAEQAERDRRIERLEAALDRAAGTTLAAAPPAAQPLAATPPASAAVPAPASAGAALPVAGVSPGAGPADRLRISGDLRVRGQGDWSDDDGRNRASAQLRGRLGATFAVNDRVTIGARLATGDSDDPNSTDVQLSNWLDDLDVSLDMAYVQLGFDQLTLFGGKFPQPFVRTDLVWDGDVNPQGLGATWRRPLDGGGALRANALAFIVDEQAAGPDSTMLGAQLGYESPARGHWKFDVHGAYYHYDLGSTAGADAGDFRSNLRNPDGSFRSDFHLANLLFGVNYAGLGTQWPVRLVGDYVRNLGAATGDDTGYGVDLIVGKASAARDWRVAYGYSATQADAVLAAFSHDNIGIATNYRLHSLTVDYVPMPRTMISAYWYHYRPYGAAHAGANDPNDWLERLRLAFLVNF